jgi:predicted nucleic acid-binding protein
MVSLVIYALERSQPLFTPTANNRLESGKILAKIESDKGFESHKLRDLHFDVLIALTARSRGAQLITSNRADFELIREYREFKPQVWCPAPKRPREFEPGTLGMFD